MRPRNSLELKRDLRDDAEFVAAYKAVYPYVAFLRNAFVKEGFAPSTRLANAFALTESGDQALDYVVGQLGGQIDSDSARYGVALTFSFVDLYVDVKRTDVSELHAALQGEVAAGSVRWIHEYGRLLYDRFFDLFPSRTEHLTYLETEKLIEGTPPGTFQMGNLLVGPLGPIRAESWRVAPPRSRAPLWHCSDVSCQKLHNVSLGTGMHSAQQVPRALIDLHRQRGGVPSEWDQLFRSLTSEERGFYALDNSHSIWWLLVDGFTEQERVELLSCALTIMPGTARDRLSSVADVQKHTSEVVAALDPASLLQVLALLDDDHLVEVVDCAAVTGMLDIPPTEVRVPVITGGMDSWLKLTPQLSELGMRFTSRSDHLPLARLMDLVRAVSHGPDGSETLDWSLRFVPGTTVEEKLLGLAFAEEPEGVLRKFLFGSPGSMDALRGFFPSMHIEPPTSPEQEELLLRRVLWRLGFPVAEPHQAMPRFRSRARAMREAVGLSRTPITHECRERIRSAAVNYFISMEEILEGVVVLAGWGLFADHYAGPRKQRFQFELTTARRFVAALLASNGATEPFDAAGSNTLWPLVQNMDFLSQLIVRRLSEPPVQGRVRPARDLPDFYLEAGIPFAFPHALPLYDLQEASARRLAERLAGAAYELKQVDLPLQRNRLEHKRPDADFPDVSEIVALLDLVDGVIGRLGESGLLPVPCVFVHGTTDAHGRDTVTLEDSDGRVVTVTLPSSGWVGSPLPPPTATQIVMSDAKLTSIRDCLRFTMEEDSPYRRMWSDYPKRILRMAPPDELTT